MEKVTELTFEFAWEPVFATEGNRYLYPASTPRFLKTAYSGPAVYRWLVLKGGKQSAIYYGEAENLARRIDGYRSGPPGQQTNHRLKNLFLGLSEDYELHLERLRFPTFRLNGAEFSESDLGKKYFRCFLENALISLVSNDVDLLNLSPTLKAKDVVKAKKVLEALTPSERSNVLKALTSEPQRKAL